MEVKSSEAETFWVGLFLLGAVACISLVGPALRLSLKMAERGHGGDKRR